MKIRKLMASLFAAALAIVAGTAAVVPAAAQSSEDTPSVKTDWSSRELHSFAAAAVAVNTEIPKWRQRIAEADDEEQAEQIQTEAQAAVAKAIESEGISVKTYNRIHAAIQADDELRQEVMGLMDEEVNEN